MTPNARLVRTWRRALPHIEDALSHCGGSHTIDDVFRLVCEGKCHLWLGQHSAAVTEWTNIGRKRGLSIWLAGGDLSEMKDCEAGMAAFARGGMADDLTYLGRPTPTMKRSAWERGTGFVLEFLSMTKDLWNGR